MGIPSFYRWLIERYPLAIAGVVEDSPVHVNGVLKPIDSSQPNPNGIEFDNLYLDMNGIIHPCFHPEGRIKNPKTYEEVFSSIFEYIDRVFSIVRPRKLLYMAIDGVAPRAKMNQQRARRFRAAKEASDEVGETDKCVVGSEGGELDIVQQPKKLDSNIITPGTEFMASLSSALQYYIHLRMNDDPGWKGIKVILSDANVPGEGEHKIMSYIRLQRNLPGFDRNTRHCLYGLDADLIMLALATHEIHFSVLRENGRILRPSQSIRKIQKKEDFIRNSEGGKALSKPGVVEKEFEAYLSSLHFQFLHVWLLREYLALDMRPDKKAGKQDLERLIDDFVFMCLFVGNDFLPHVPSLEISEGAIDLLMVVYKKEYNKMGGYLTDSFKVNLKRVVHFIHAVGTHENAIFTKRIKIKKIKEEQGHNYADANIPAEYTTDEVNLGVKGWRERYYTIKFQATTDEERENIRKNAVLKYLEGICWVMRYYYEGVCSWKWFYPYHYAPFATDFHNVEDSEIQFTLGKPFKPFDQLMGVLPPASAHALPLFYRKLMMESSSPLLDFYPSDFQLDMNGKRFAWQAICKLPFVKESRLLSEIAKVESTLTDEERRRNFLGLDMLFVHISHPLSVKILSFSKRNQNHPKLATGKVKRKINPKFSHGMNGYMYISEKSVSPQEIHSPIENMEMIQNNKVISVFYKYPSPHRHIPRPPEGIIAPAQSLKNKLVLHPPILWHTHSMEFMRNNRRPLAYEPQRWQNDRNDRKRKLGHGGMTRNGYGFGREDVMRNGYGFGREVKRQRTR